MEWLDEVFRYVMEDRREQFEILLAYMPLARTPWDSQGARALNNQYKSLANMLQGMTPWMDKRERRSALRDKVKPGTVVVIADGTEGNLFDNPLFEGTEIVH